MELVKNLVLRGYNVYVTSLKPEENDTNSKKKVNPHDFVQQQASVCKFIKSIVKRLTQQETFLLIVDSFVSYSVENFFSNNSEVLAKSKLVDGVIYLNLSQP